MNLMNHDIESLAKKFGKCDSETIDEIIRQAEAYLEAQLATALASDQRALIFASIVGANLAILVGATATLAASSLLSGEILIPMLPIALLFLVSMGFGIYACRPVLFRTVGNNPKQWLEDIESGQSLARSKADTAALYLRAIEENAVTMKAAAEALKIALNSAFCGVAFSALFTVLVILF